MSKKKWIWICHGDYPPVGNCTSRSRRTYDTMKEAEKAAKKHNVKNLHVVEVRRQN